MQNDRIDDPVLRELVLAQWQEIQNGTDRAVTPEEYQAWRVNFQAKQKELRELMQKP